MSGAACVGSLYQGILCKLLIFKKFSKHYTQQGHHVNTEEMEGARDKNTPSLVSFLHTFTDFSSKLSQ